MTSNLPEPWRGASQPPYGAHQPPGPPHAPPPVPYQGPQPPGEQVLVSIGDIGVTRTSVITPSGSAPLSRCSFQFTDLSRTTEEIPAWAIVMAVLFAVFCLLGLLFLLAKESRTAGSVQVVVQGPRLLHTVQIPVWSPYQVQDMNARVNYARSLAVAGR